MNSDDVQHIMRLAATALVVGGLLLGAVRYIDNGENHKLGYATWNLR